jgi:hypothetical protein
MYSTNVNAERGCLNTAIHAAARMGHRRIVRFLEKQGAVGVTSRALLPVLLDNKTDQEMPKKFLHTMEDVF